MTLTVSSDTVIFSDTVTNTDIINFPGTQSVGTWSISGDVLTLSRHIEFADNVNLDAVFGWIITLNGYTFRYESYENGTTLRHCAIDAASNSHLDFGDIKTKDCTIFWGASGNSLANLGEFSNLIFISRHVGKPADGAGRGSGIIVKKSGNYSGVNLVNPFRFGYGSESTSSTSYIWDKRAKVYGQGYGVDVAYNMSPSVIMEDFLVENVPNFEVLLYDPNGATRAHTVMLLGSTVNAVTRMDTHSNRKVLKAGIKYWTFPNEADGVELELYNSQSATKQTLVPTLSNGTSLLEDTTTVGVSGIATFVVPVSTKQGNIETQITDSQVYAKKFGKLIRKTTWQDNAAILTTEGSESAGSAQLLADYPQITHTKTQVGAFDKSVDNTLSHLIEKIHLKTLSVDLKDLPNDGNIISFTGSTINIPDGWTLEVDTSGGKYTDLDLTNSKILTNVSLVKDSNFDTVSGSVNVIQGNVDFSYLDSSGQVAISLNFASTESITAICAGAYLLDRADAETSKTLEADGKIVLSGLTPSTDYNVVVEGVGAYRQELVVNSGEYGAQVDVELEVINSHGTPIFPTSVPADKQWIVDLSTYDAVNQIGEIELPTDFYTNSAYDDYWQDVEGFQLTVSIPAEDSIYFLLGIERLQSGLLSLPKTLTLRENEIIRDPDSVFRLQQSSTNVKNSVYPTFRIVGVEAYINGDDSKINTWILNKHGCVEFDKHVTIATVNTPQSVADSFANQIPTKVDEASAVVDIKATIDTNLDAKVSEISGLTDADRTALTNIDTRTSRVDDLIVIDGADDKFSAIALENGPSGGGSGGGGLTASQASELSRIHNSQIAHRTTTVVSDPDTSDVLDLTVALSNAAGVYNNHYIVINDGSGSPVQRYIESSTASGQNTTFRLNAGVIVPNGVEVLILIRTTAQDGIEGSGGGGGGSLSQDDIDQIKRGSSFL